jgi:hypothetical protein
MAAGPYERSRSEAGRSLGVESNPLTPVFWIWKAAFASFRVGSKFDIANGTRGLGYLDAILA